ncbi:unnamed protein product [Linum trigynum]|uniref:Uncharacterized protein n=1 Tax=Linum trigynum TaxID=586398 RepID=A0AAV2DZ71_9ROSI
MKGGIEIGETISKGDYAATYVVRLTPTLVQRKRSRTTKKMMNISETAMTIESRQIFRCSMERWGSRSFWIGKLKSIGFST